MTDPLVSVIVPCYNQAVYLSDALDSIFAQSYQNWECIIVNDGSTDNTEDVANNYCQLDSRFRYLYRSNGGLANARNCGIKMSHGCYVLPLDADDKISSDYLRDAINVLEKNPEVKLVYCKAEFFGEQRGIWNLPEYSYDRLLFQNHIFCSAVYRKSDFDATNGYDDKMKSGWEDWDFWLSLLKRGDKVYKIERVHFYYRIRQSSMLRAMTSKDEQSLYRLIYQNHKQIYDAEFNHLFNLVELDGYRRRVEVVEAKYEAVLRSRDYRIGSLLLRPLRLFRNALIGR